MLRPWYSWGVYGAARMNKSLYFVMATRQEKPFVDGISNDFGVVLNQQQQ